MSARVQFTIFKVLEWIFAILAFSTCVSYSGMFRMSVECANRSESDLNIVVEFEYPFRLYQVYFDAPTCHRGNTERFFLVGDYSSPAEFFVTIGVLALVYASVALCVYVFFEKYKNNNKGPVIDLVLTVFFAFLWLVSSALWVKGLSDVKEATEAENVLTLISACDQHSNRCREVYDPVTSILNASVVFGFINLILWTGNIWFVCKQTGIIASCSKSPSPQAKPAEATRGAYKQDPSGQKGDPPDYNQKGSTQDAVWSGLGPADVSQTLSM